MRISEAGVRDALPLLALHRGVLEEGDFFISVADEYQVSLEAQTAWISAFRASENSVILCARDPLLKGFVSLQGGVLARMRHAAKLEIMVSRQHRGQGVGRALLGAALTWAEANPLIEKIGLSVFATNVRAVALYEAHGFEHEGRREREYRMADGSYRADILMYRYV
jgi:ribosomal protein S18 acetylase RimI-like enzyme